MAKIFSRRSRHAHSRFTSLASVSRIALFTAVGTAVLLSPVASHAHTDSLGFIISDGSSDGLYNFQIFYGSWHSGVGAAEGALDLSRGGSIVATENFQLFPGYTAVSNGTLPPGLVAGSNYFFPDNSTPDPDDLTGDPSGHSIFAFQYVTFTDMTAADYTFGYNAGSSFTANWEPSANAINQGSFKVNSDGSLGGVGGVQSSSFQTGESYTEEQLGNGDVQPEFDGGTLTIGNPATVTSDFTINEAGGNIDTQGNDTTASGSFTGTGGLTKQGSGTLTLTGANTYTGGTTISGGTLVASTGTLPGNVTNNASLVLNQGADGTFSGVISGSGGLTKTGAGTLTLTGANTYTGGTTISGGTLVATPTALSGNVINNAVLVLDQDTDGAFNGAISGTGTVKKTGSGTLDITSGSSFTVSALEVNEGSVNLNANIGGSSVAIGSGATLTGNGTLGGLIVHTSGTAAPGGNAAGIGTSGGLHTSGGRITTVAAASSIGKLTSATYVVFEPGSHYDVEVDAAGNTDKVEATGTATLQGGTVHVLAQNGDYAPATSYEILSAENGVTGTFAGVDSNLAFLVPVLGYDGSSVTLTLLRNDLSFADVAATPNQIAAGGAADEAFDFGSDVYMNLMGATAGETQAAFDSFSGEVHATAMASVAQSTAGLRRALLARGARLSTAPEGQGVSLWVQGLGEWGSLEGNGNAADVDNTTYGVLIGTELQMSDSLRLGLLTGYSEMDVVVGARHSRATVESNHAGAYAAYTNGGLSLRGGGTYSALRFDTERTAAVRGFAEQLQAVYDGSATQLFAEAAYRMPQGRGHVEPFAGIDKVWVSKDGFTERGGSTALTDAGENEDYTWSTLGLRAAVPAATRQAITLQGAVAWQHALGSTAAEAVMNFDGGSAFTVAGAPLEKDSLVLDAGIEWRVMTNVAVGVNYAGTLSDRRTDQSLKLSLSLAL